MNWDNHLSHVISAADGTVAKIRERLAVPGRLSREREGVYPERDPSHATGSDLPLRPGGAAQWADLAAVQAQLHHQRQVEQRKKTDLDSEKVELALFLDSWCGNGKLGQGSSIRKQVWRNLYELAWPTTDDCKASSTIESLTQNLRSVERERDAQQRQIQALQEETRRLRERLEDREAERGKKQEMSGEKVPAVEMRLEQWKREVGRELSAMRGHIHRATSLGNQEESFSSKLCREEVEQLRREVDLLKSKLMRHEEDMYQQQSEARETRRQCERSCKTLGTITDSYRTHGFELSRVISQYQHTQQDLRDLRLTVSGLKGEVRSLILRDRLDTPAEMPRKSCPSEVAVETSPRGRLLSDSDDELSPTPSLGDVSSDDLDTSWLGESGSAPKLQSGGPHACLSLSGSDLSDAVSGFASSHWGTDGKTGRASGSSPELSLCDL